MSEKPLHVQVAEALGWTHCQPEEFAAGESDEWFGVPPGKLKQDVGPDYPEVYAYDTSWSVTGPLIEKYEINLDCVGPGCWTAQKGWSYRGSTPLEAVCLLIVGEAREERLEPAEPPSARRPPYLRLHREAK